jgi:3-mercaptopyruvate sulfurtransferase SseA
MEASMSEAQGFAHPEFLVETEWLAAHLDDPNLIVLDGTVHLIPDPKITYTVKSGREDFEKGHIPGAQFADLQEDLSAQHPKLRFMLPSAEAFAAAMGRFGVGERSHVVLYSTTTPQWATRIWWMLRNYGFDNAAVLNGGFQKWAREGRPVQTGPALPRVPARFVVRGDRRTGRLADRPADRRLSAGGGIARQIRRGRRVRQRAGHHLLRRRHRGERRCVGAGHARSPRCAALRRLDVGMGQ